MLSTGAILCGHVYLAGTFFQDSLSIVAQSTSGILQTYQIVTFEINITLLPMYDLQWTYSDGVSFQGIISNRMFTVSGIIDVKVKCVYKGVSCGEGSKLLEIIEPIKVLNMWLETLSIDKKNRTVLAEIEMGSETSLAWQLQHPAGSIIIASKSCTLHNNMLV